MMPSINYKLLASTLLAFVVILVLFGVGLFNFISYTPKELRVTNIFDRSVAVSWLTSRSDKEKVFVSTSNWRVAIPLLKNFLADTYDEQSSDNTHYVTVKNLLPNQKYFFSLPASFQIISFSTKQTPESFNLPAPAYGIVVASDGKTPVSNALIYFNDFFSTVTNNSGGWTFDLSTLSDTKKIGVEVVSAKLERARIVLNASEVQPAPIIVLK